MSVLGLIDKSRVDAGFGAIEAPSTEFSDVVPASLEATARNYLTSSKDFFEGRERSTRDQKYKELTGRDLYEDAIQASPQAEKMLERRKRLGDANAFRFDPEVLAAVDQHIGTLKTQDPTKFQGVFNSEEITGEVKRKARESLAKSETVQAGATPFAAVAGNLVGGAAASFIDPLNLATIPLGAGISAGIIKTALIEAGVNIGAEIVSHPFVSEWQKELGNEYGAADFAENIGMAALFGAGLGAATKAIPMGYAKAKNLMFDQMAAKFDELDNIPARDAARAESRRVHIESADPARLIDDVDPQAHRQALEEADAAINQGRAIDPERIPLTDDQVRAMDPARMDEGARAVHARIVEDAPEFPRVYERNGWMGIGPQIDALPQVLREIRGGEEIRLSGGFKTEKMEMALTGELGDMELPAVFARNSDGEIVGSLSVKREKVKPRDPEKFVVAMVEVSDNYRRKGVADALYTYANAYLAKIESSHFKTDIGKKFATKFDYSALDGKSRSLVVAQTSPPPKRHPILDFDRPRAPNVERQMELVELYESPEMRAREKADFEAKFKDSPDHEIHMDQDEGSLSPAAIRQIEAEDSAFIRAISSCELGSR